MSAVILTFCFLGWYLVLSESALPHIDGVTILAGATGFGLGLMFRD